MGKYIQYKRINQIYTPKELEDKLKEIIKDGFEIIHYDEKILEKTETFERIIVTMLLGKLNEGVKQIL